MAFSGSTACAGDASSAANATERTRAEATDCKIKIQPPAYYLSNDSRCYYYSATDFLVAEAVKYYTLLDKLRPTTVDKICRENALALIKTY